MRQARIAMRVLATMSLTSTSAMRMGARFYSSGYSEMSRAKKARMVAVETSRYITGEEGNNVTPYIANLVGRNLHKIESHPLGIIKSKIEAYFDSLEGQSLTLSTIWTRSSRDRSASTTCSSPRITPDASRRTHTT